MNLPLETIKIAQEKPVSFIESRTDLNLPPCQTTFPFRPKQREAVELGLSNGFVA